MWSETKKFSRENLDLYLKELAKHFRKLNGKAIPAEIVIIGGASVVMNYGFRDSTEDIDAIIKASSAMKDAMRIVSDAYNLDPGWINDNFKYTTSYSDKIPQYAKYYKTFSNIVRIYTISGAYLIAMKMMAGRDYKFDLSDIIGILYYHYKNGDPISRDDIVSAAINLYGSYDAIPNESKEYLDNVMSYKDLEYLYNNQYLKEVNNRNLLTEFGDNYPNVLNKDNIREILKELQNKE